MRRLFFALLVFIPITGVVLVAVLALHGGLAAPPTLVPTPTDTVTMTPDLLITDSATPTATPSPTPTSTPSSTMTFTPSVTPSPTSTLAVRLLSMVAINPGVTLNGPTATILPTLNPTPLPTIAVPAPPLMADIPRAVFTPITLTPVGWVRYEDTDPQVIYTGQWQGYGGTWRATNHHYTYTDDPYATATLKLVGAGVRVRYVLSRVGGIFDLSIDGQTVATIDSYLDPTVEPTGGFQVSAVFQLANGWHTVELINTGRKQAASDGTVVGLDAIEIYKDGLPPTLDPVTRMPQPTSTATPTAAAALAIQLVLAPPTIPPTITPVAPGMIDLSVVIGYDADGNKVIEPSEGVAGVSVRVVRADTNHVVASGLTDSAGYIHLQVEQTGGLLVIVPYLGKSWALPAPSGSNTGASYAVSYTLLVPPVNEPALIP